MKKIYFLITLCVLFCTSTHAQTFTFNSINYTITDAINNYVEVGNNSGFSGAANITETVTDPDTSIDYTVTSIDDYAFLNCTGLTSITIPDSVTSIGDYAFRDCIGLTGITIPNSVTSIADYAFFGCTGLTSITIPNSVTSISLAAFYNCTGLTSITIGNSVTSIDQFVFYGCTGLISVTSLNPTPPTIVNENAFHANTYAGTLSVPAASIAAYDAATVWQDFGGAVLNVEQVNEVEAMLYPNPVVETLYIQLQPNDVLTSVTLHNINGQKILESTTNTLDMSSLTNGVYFATILTNNGTATKKIVK